MINKGTIRNEYISEYKRRRAGRSLKTVCFATLGSEGDRKWKRQMAKKYRGVHEHIWYPLIRVPGGRWTPGRVVT